MIRRIRLTFLSTFRPNSGALPFFTSIIVWGIGAGCFAATLNNFLVDIYDLSEVQRGLLEFFREMPGLLLVFLLALLHRKSDWYVFRLGLLIAMAGAILLTIPTNFAVATLLIMIWSTGEHLAMPVRHSIAMSVARKGRAGASLGYVSSALNGGHVVGNLLVALLFLLGVSYFKVEKRVILYNIVWILIFLLAGTSALCTLSRHKQEAPVRRPRLLLRRKFGLFYGLELFYGARKQIFLTFAPFVLIREYGADTSYMALLLGIAALLNMVAGPWIGRLTDLLGYRTVMVYDTFILVFVCLLYGFAGDWFPRHIAFWVVSLNFLLDAIISTTSLASNIYVRDISSNSEELTSTLSTGISMNHLVSVVAGPLGGIVWMRWGIGPLFAISALLGLGNSWCAMQIPLRKGNR